MKSSQLAFSKISVFLLLLFYVFNFYFRKKKKVNLKNNSEIGYDSIDGV
jgi:hypothetical protein